MNELGKLVKVVYVGGPYDGEFFMSSSPPPRLPVFFVNNKRAPGWDYGHYELCRPPKAKRAVYQWIE